MHRRRRVRVVERTSLLKRQGVIALAGSNPAVSAQKLEDWMSGLNQQFTKLSSRNWLRGFESHILRKDIINDILSLRMEQKIIDHLLSVYKPRAIILHGSRASGKAIPTSDWDFIMLVDEPKEPTRGYVDGENVEFVQKKLPIKPEDAFKVFGIKFREGNVRIVYDPENIAAPLVAACREEIAKGLELTKEDKQGRRAFMEGLLSKISRFHDNFMRFEPMGDFISRATYSWFPVKEKRYSIATYDALAYLQEHDPEYVKMLEKFGSASGDQQIEVGNKILDYLFPNEQE